MPPPAPCSTRKTTSEVVEAGNGAQRRADREQHQRGHVHALGAEAARRPAGHGDHRGQRQQVAGHHPLDLRDRAVQVVAERAQRDVDDRRVEDRHDHPEDHHAGDLPHVRLDAVGSPAGPCDSSAGCVSDVVEKPFGTLSLGTEGYFFKRCGRLLVKSGGDNVWPWACSRLLATGARLRLDARRPARRCSLRCARRSRARRDDGLADVGGGTGNYALALAREGWHPVVVDRSRADARARGRQGA